MPTKDLSDAIKNGGRPALIVHGPSDEKIQGFIEGAAANLKSNADYRVLGVAHSFADLAEIVYQFIDQEDLQVWGPEGSKPLDKKISVYGWSKKEYVGGGSNAPGDVIIGTIQKISRAINLPKLIIFVDFSNGANDVQQKMKAFISSLNRLNGNCKIVISAPSSKVVGWLLEENGGGISLETLSHFDMSECC